MVYTETVVHSAPSRYVAEAPYQIAIIILDTGLRVTARIEGTAVGIGDSVELIDNRGGVPWFRRIE
jgi:uncharacterized OB-fold protein